MKSKIMRTSKHRLKRAVLKVVSGFCFIYLGLSPQAQAQTVTKCEADIAAWAAFKCDTRTEDFIYQTFDITNSLGGTTNLTEAINRAKVRANEICDETKNGWKSEKINIGYGMVVEVDLLWQWVKMEIAILCPTPADEEKIITVTCNFKP